MQGLMPNYVKVVPSIAIAFVSYEEVGNPYLCWSATVICVTTPLFETAYILSAGSKKVPLLAMSVQARASTRLLHCA